MPTRDRAVRAVRAALRAAGRQARRALSAQNPRRQRDRTPVTTPLAGNDSDTQPGDTQPGATYPGDFVGVPPMHYAPQDDGEPDPGEVVWGWVPYEEDHTQGKDRPVLVIGTHGRWLLALPLTSKDHDRDQEQEAAAGRHWIDIGSGDWDARRRPSEVRTNRILQLDPAGIRREGGRISEDVFTRVAAEVGRRN